jgi:hypothetical protein
MLAAGSRTVQRLQPKQKMASCKICTADVYAQLSEDDTALCGKCKDAPMKVMSVSTVSKHEGSSSNSSSSSSSCSGAHPACSSAHQKLRKLLHQQLP